MCGIAAVWGSRDFELARDMIGELGHRGPDGEGVHSAQSAQATLAHSRLAIIDPAGGEQPIVADDGATALVANGMIYNDRALRAELSDAPYHTGSDSESILHLINDRGLDAVDQLDGMFAFVMVRDGRLVAARDPIGIKPLYMGRRNGDLCFASEIKALAEHAEDIREFPAGHTFHSDQGFRPYYDIPAGPPVQQTPERIMARLRDTIEAAVVKRLRSDVPLGAFLSGGLDSSIIAALARRHVDELLTFAVGLEGSPDLLAARRVADHLGTRHHEIEIDVEDVRRALPDVLFHLESFDRDLVRSAVPCYFVSQVAAQHVKVVLTGEGADELFAGYTYYRDYTDPRALHRELRRSISAMHNINLQRVDRMTMAHGLEARVPFLDRSVIALAMEIDPLLKLPPNIRGANEKWILRKAFEDLLPPDIVWRDKAQFDQGSGVADLLMAVAPSMACDIEDSRGVAAPNGRGAEEACYGRLLAQSYDDPAPVFDLVAHWDDRPAA